MRVLSHQLLITAEDKCVRVDLPEYILLLRWIHDLLHSLLNNAYRYLLHLVALCCVFHEELIWGKTLYFDRFLELLHIVFQRYLRFVHEQSREHWHLDVIKPVQTPLDIGIWEDICKSLSDLSLYIDRFIFVNEINHVFRQRFSHERRAQSLFESLLHFNFFSFIYFQICLCLFQFDNI